MVDLKEIVKEIKRAQFKEYDSALAISGYVGEGKSTFSMQLMKEYYNIKTLSEFKRMCETYLVYSRRELEKITTTQEKKFINIDEAINVLFKRDFMKGDQKNLLRTLDVCRDMKHAFTFIIPSFWALDSHTIQTRIRLWVHVEKQKYAHLSRPLRNPYTLDVWNRAVNEKVIAKTNSITNTLNYISSLTFEALSPEEYEIYKKIKHEKRLKARDEADKKPDISKSEIARLIYNTNSNTTHAEIAKILNIRRPTVTQALKGRKVDTRL